MDSLPRVFGDPPRLAIGGYLAIVSRYRERIWSILSPGEIAIYQASKAKWLNAEIARLKGEIQKLPTLRAEKEEICHEIEKQKFALQTLAKHERAKLSSRILTNYCRPETLRNGRAYVRWPSFGCLGGITECVEKYLRFTRERVRQPRPPWKAFELLDKRVPSVQLVDQVNELAKRAQDRLREDPSLARDARPLMWWLALIGHPSARQLMKFDRVTQGVVKELKQRTAKEKAQSKREATRERVRRHRALADSRYIETR
jgi:hypothetical protein